MTQIAEPATLGSGAGRSAPFRKAGRNKVIRTAAILTTAWVASDILPIEDYGRIALRFALTPHADATAGQAIVRVMVANEMVDDAAPEVDDDVWEAKTIVSPTGTATALVGAVAAGETVTMSQEWGVVTVQPLVFVLSNGLSGSGGDDEESRLSLPLDVGEDQYLYVAVKAHGDLTNISTLGIKYNVSF